MVFAKTFLNIFSWFDFTWNHFKNEWMHRVNITAFFWFFSTLAVLCLLSKIVTESNHNRWRVLMKMLWRMKTSTFSWFLMFLSTIVSFYPSLRFFENCCVCYIFGSHRISFHSYISALVPVFGPYIWQTTFLLNTIIRLFVLFYRCLCLTA